MRSSACSILGFMLFYVVKTKAIHPDCSSRDSCFEVGDVEFSKKNCECDDICAFYGDCCQDAATVRFIPKYRNLTFSTCTAFGIVPYRGVYMIDSCFSNDAEEQRIKCDDRQSNSNSFSAAPVSSMISGSTFKNINCAECNNASSFNLKPWLVLLDCDSLGVFSIKDKKQNIKYNSSINSWGIQLEDKFHTCEPYFDMPSYITTSRLCRANVVSSCPASWSDVSVLNACESYMGVVYTKTVAYRNKDCALCNGVKEDGYTCEKPNSVVRRWRPFNFAMLMDVNSRYGNRVGQKQRCPSNQIYDPFFRRCRIQVWDIPGFPKARKG